MPRCCITKYLLDSLPNVELPAGYIHYYDEEIRGFLLEYRGKGRGTWYFRYRDAENKTRLFNLGALSKLTLTDARAYAYSVHKLVEEGGDPKKDVHLLREAPSLELFAFEHYMPHARMKKRSWQLDLRILKLHLLPRFGKHRMDKIRRTDIISWQGEMKEKGLAPGTCNRAFVLFKSIFNCAIRWNVLQADQNPCRNVSLFEDNVMRERYLTPDEARMLLKELNNCPNTQGAAAIRLLLFTGARKNEILSARWENVDFNRRLLTVPLSKSGKTRHIPLSDEAINILMEIPRQEGNPWVFPLPSGSHMTSVFKLWADLRARLGLKDVRLHDLRHSFASFLVNSGCSLYEVQKCLGHYDPRVTMRYAHLAPQSLVRAANMVGKSVMG